MQRREHREALDPHENCSRGIDPLNNSYMTDVMIIAEFPLLRERGKPKARRRGGDERTSPSAGCGLRWKHRSQTSAKQKDTNVAGDLVLIHLCIR